ncbi:phosphoglyceromutase 1 [uncultured delta proteobacterium]|uniref:2,3-bisphosphoglycerate-dependent phosphoglycerate mutase n=1 Tax=uncultured delta proteobacterium TaxID=34034 RepID=A0A212J8S4_9DELT|nr:phosphoglyceromutase 1 [uncultured delta proteobacterium]
MQLVLVRHGESEWNRLNLFTGWHDVGLSETGVNEAMEGGRLLREGGFDFDICHTSYLKRAIHTLNLVLEQLDREWLPVVKTWKLNERHYGALQGLNKAETAAKYGEEQVKIWRRSFDVPPPPLAEDDARSPRMQEQYRNEDKALLPLAESLKDTIARVVPYYESVIKKDLLAGRRVLIAAHGNSLRALVKYLDNLSDEAIVELNIPTGVPLVYELDESLNVRGSRYLGDQEAIRKKMDSVAKQGKAR